MTDYIEYTKGGDILIAPSLSYKHQYVLKCALCEAFFGEFKYFFPHYLSHYEIESSEEECLFQEDTLKEEQFDDDVINENIPNGSVNKIADDEEQLNIGRVDSISSFGEEDINENKSNGDNKNKSVNEEQKLLDDCDMPCTQIEIEHETLKLDEQSSNAHDDQLDTEESTALAVNKENFSQDKSNLEFFYKLMKCKEHVTALIEAYKNERHLWDFSVPVHNRKMEMRILTWDKIAKELENNINLSITGNQVAACIFYLRQRYRERKRCAELSTKSTNITLPSWIYQRMQFLKPFIESNPIGLLDIHQDLSPKQIIHVFNIYKKFENLWNTNKMEYYCTNMRGEALSQMMICLTNEMDLEVDIDGLKSYINGIRHYFSSAKRYKRAATMDVTNKGRYYQHLCFLSDHVGPFQCSFCHQGVHNPLGLKAHESQHTGENPFQCPECKKEFKNSDTFVFHMRRHMGDLTHECKLCGKKFLRALEVKEHMRCHTGDRPFCCEVCGASFSHRTGFGRHKKLHTKKYISFCPYCSKGFYTKDAMMKHSVVHQDERHFMCSTCGKAFKTKTTLKSHVATHENGNYECDVCSKTFKNKINLWQHKRKHRLNALKKLESPSPFDSM